MLAVSPALCRALIRTWPSGVRRGRIGAVAATRSEVDCLSGVPPESARAGNRGPGEFILAPAPLVWPGNVAAANQCLEAPP